MDIPRSYVFASSYVFARRYVCDWCYQILMLGELHILVRENLGSGENEILNIRCRDILEGCGHNLIGETLDLIHNAIQTHKEIDKTAEIDVLRVILGSTGALRLKLTVLPNREGIGISDRFVNDVS